MVTNIIAVTNLNELRVIHNEISAQ